MPIETLHDLYVKELRDLYEAEKLLLTAVPKMMDRAEMPELRQALAHHTEEIREQITRLERVFALHGEKSSTKQPEILEGILQEGAEDVDDVATRSLKDAVVIASLQQVKHYEIAAYGTLKAYATHLGYREAAEILDETLDEEKGADQRLTQIALDHLRVETHA